MMAGVTKGRRLMENIARSVPQFVRGLRAPVLALALLAGGIGIGASAPSLLKSSAPVMAQEATPMSEAADVCPDELYGPDSEPWEQAELYFGTTQDNGTPYSESDFDAFLDNEITPRFPDGLTLLTGLGQWRNSEGVISQERSMLLIILYPPDPSGETSAKFEEIRDLYEQQFHQESVLRADSGPVCTSF
jgi:Protein of unknown function (DUF3574)